MIYKTTVQETEPIEVSEEIEETPYKAFYHIDNHIDRLNAYIEANTEYFKAVVEDALNNKGELWVIAALVDGSIGYYQPNSAHITLERFKQGEIKWYSERCSACFRNNGPYMIYCDVERFKEIDTDKQDAIIDYCKALIDADNETQLSYSMLYPTMNIKKSEKQ